MTWFKNLKIRTKLLFSFLLVASLAGIVGTVGLLAIRVMDDNAVAMYENMTVPLADVAQMSEDYQRIRINLRDMVFAPNAQERESAANTIVEVQNSLTRSSDAFAARILSEEMQQAYDHYVVARREFIAERDHVMELTRQEGSQEEAITALFGPAYAKAQETMNALDTIKAMKLRHALERQQANAEAASKARTIMLAAMLGAVFLALVLGILIARVVGGPARTLASAAGKVAEGQYDIRVEEGTRDEMGALGRAFNAMVERIRDAIDQAQEQGRQAQVARADAEVAQQEAMAQQDYLARSVEHLLAEMNRFADGDLTVNVQPERADDEIAQLFQGFNRAVRNLQGMIGQVRRAVDDTAQSCIDISGASEQLASAAQEQSAQSQEVAAAVEQMVRTIVENSRNATETAEVARRNGLAADEGGEVVNRTVDKIRQIAGVVADSAQTVERLGHSSQQVGEIVQVIDEIADQTNLLALNAAIEAARAGDQGRGFAVVADEVRKLAERTTAATKEIASMIQAIQQETQGAVAAMRRGTEEVEEGIVLADQAGDALKTIVTGTDRTVEMVTQIAAANEEQSTTSEQIARTVEMISAVSGEAAQGISQIAHSTEGLSRLSGDLRDLVARFKVAGATQTVHHGDGHGHGAVELRAAAVR